MPYYIFFVSALWQCPQSSPWLSRPFKNSHTPPRHLSYKERPKIEKGGLEHGLTSWILATESWFFRWHFWMWDGCPSQNQSWTGLNFGLTDPGPRAVSATWIDQNKFGLISSTEKVSTMRARLFPFACLIQNLERVTASAHKIGTHSSSPGVWSGATWKWKFRFQTTQYIAKTNKSFLITKWSSN